MKKKSGVIKLKINSGKATAAPPIGSALGQKGLNIIEFCKKFNLQTSFYSPSVQLSVLITFYSDKSYDFIVKKESLSNLLKVLLDINSFSDKTKKFFVNIESVKKLSIYKMSDFNTINLYCSIKIVIGSLKSMGINLI